MKALRLEDSHLLRMFEDALTPLPEKQWSVGSCAEDDAFPKVVQLLREETLKTSNPQTQASKIIINHAMLLLPPPGAGQVTMMESCLNCDQKLLILLACSEKVTYYDLLHFAPASGSLQHTF